MFRLPGRSAPSPKDGHHGCSVVKDHGWIIDALTYIQFLGGFGSLFQSPLNFALTYIQFLEVFSECFESLLTYQVVTKTVYVAKHFVPPLYLLVQKKHFGLNFLKPSLIK